MLAATLGCTVQELGARVSAWEFAEWQIIFRKEQMHPMFGRIQHAQTLAATLQGPSKRKGGKGWSAADFMESDPWAPAPVQAAAAAAPVSQAERMRRMAQSRRG